MSRLRSKVTAQGQISVPAEIRRRMAIGPGSVLEWEEEGDAVLVRRLALHSFNDIHQAVFASKPKPRKLEDLERAIRRHAKARHARH